MKTSKKFAKRTNSIYRELEVLIQSLFQFLEQDFNTGRYKIASLPYSGGAYEQPFDLMEMLYLLEEEMNRT